MVRASHIYTLFACRIVKALACRAISEERQGYELG